jgi:hypothetical protein
VAKFADLRCYYGLIGSLFETTMATKLITDRWVLLYDQVIPKMSTFLSFTKYSHNHKYQTHIHAKSCNLIMLTFYAASLHSNSHASTNIHPSSGHDHRKPITYRKYHNSDILHAQNTPTYPIEMPKPLEKHRKKHPNIYRYIANCDPQEY